MMRCASCETEITWANTINGRRIPLEIAPHGNIVIDESGRCLFLSKETRPKHTEQTYVSHFAACPGAPKHRRSKS